MRACMSVQSMRSETDWEPQFLERLTYFKSVVEILVVFDVCILVCYLWQLVIYNVLLITM
jgi:hypothetical protein